MVIGDRLKMIRESKGLSQGAIEKRTGLIRCYQSRCENGHTVPSIETLEKFARALEVPMYQLFYDGEKPPAAKDMPKLKEADKLWGTSRKDSRMLMRFRRLLGKATPADRKLLLHVANQMAGRA